jgi:RND family efflux transporter MFP subunit
MPGKRTGLILGLAGVGLAAVTMLQARGAATPPATHRKTRPEQLRIAAEGRVVAHPGAEVVVAAERAGRILRLAVDESLVVRKGQLLAELDRDELRAALAEASARVTEAEAERRLAERTLARREGLTAEGVLSAHDLDQARRDLDAARARVDTGRAEVARYEAQLRKMRILAPIGGTVIARHADAGEFVDAGDRIVTLADLTRLRVEGEADEADAGHLRAGAAVEITADGYPGRTWRGQVEEVADAVTLRRLKPQDPSRPTDTRILAVKVAFSEPTPLKLGTTVELKIQARR